ncbi:MAG: NAD(+) synthetase [Thermoprotei archaeon]|nr:MAG: NAD(+) synthetase [Thermoprotei archaeon]
MALKVPSLDYSKVEEAIKSFIRSKVEEAGVKGVVVGLSGGVDSSVTASLCVRALGSDRVKGLIMPDSAVTPSEDVEDALKIAEHLGIECKSIDINPLVQTIVRSHPFYDPSKVVAEGNVRARLRMILLYYVANTLKLLVAGTGDRSEIMIGYFTKYGDGGVDILPIGGLYKTQVRELGRYLNLPSRVVEKPSSPRLWSGQTAEGELGLSYDVIDPVLYGLYDLGLPPRRVAEEVGVPLEVVERVKGMVEATQHKRSMPPVAPIT